MSGMSTETEAVRRRPSETITLPLLRTALCLDCDSVFGLGAEACPACGSRTWITLSRFLEGAQPTHAREAS